MKNLFSWRALTIVCGALLTSTMFVACDEEEVEGAPVPGGNTEIIASEAVDLGLSVKWASCNLGANNPWEYGNYYAWGETTPKTAYVAENSQTYGKLLNDLRRYKGVVETFFASDKQGNIVYKIKDTGRTDENGHPVYEYVLNEEGKKVFLYDKNQVCYLSSEYDAAAKALGEDWHMPTKEEIDELFNKCTWTWGISIEKQIDADKNGKYEEDKGDYTEKIEKAGYTVKGPNGKKIYFPLNGYCGPTGAFWAEVGGTIWSAELYDEADNTHALAGMYNRNSKSSNYGYERLQGCAVRPVYGALKRETRIPDETVYTEAPIVPCGECE